MRNGERDQAGKHHQSSAVAGNKGNWGLAVGCGWQERWMREVGAQRLRPA